MKKSKTYHLIIFLLICSMSISGCFGSLKAMETAEATLPLQTNTNELEIILDGNVLKMDQPVQNIDGRILVPLRGFSSAIEADTHWDGERNAVRIEKDGGFVEFYIGSMEYALGAYGEYLLEGDLDVAPQLMNGVTYVPIRALAEIFDYSVGWDAGSNRVLIEPQETELPPVSVEYTTEGVMNRIAEHVENYETDFTINAATEVADLLDADAIVERFDDVRGGRYLLTPWADGITHMRFRLEYYMHTTIVNAHFSGEMDSLNDKEKAVYYKALELVKELCPPHYTDYEKEKAVHDYLVLNTRYAEEATGDEYIENAHTPYGALIEGSAVCDGYSGAFKILMEMSGIECDFITGMTGDIGHAWNRVKLSGAYYLVDVTWDDPTPDQPGVVLYNYFNITDEMMERRHTPDKPSPKKANSLLYNYYHYNDLVVGSQADFNRILKRAAENGERRLDVMGLPIDVGRLSLDNVFYYYDNCTYAIDDEMNTLMLNFD